VTGGHHACGPIQNRSEIVALRQLGFAGRDPHPHRQLQRPLRGHRGIDRCPRRGERGTHPVTGVLEQEAAVRLNRLAQHVIMGGQRRPHPLRVGLPPTGRTLDIGEQKRHHPRRSSRRNSGHPRRISQQTRSHLAHRRIRPQTPAPGGAVRRSACRLPGSLAFQHSREHRQGQWSRHEPGGPQRELHERSARDHRCTTTLGRLQGVGGHPLGGHVSEGR
jgi:hypothetical protein